MHKVKSQADVHLELLQMEKTMSSGDGTMSASSLLAAAFDIEDMQWVLCLDPLLRMI